MQLEDYVIKLKKLDLSSNKVKDLLYLFIQVDIFGEEAFSKKNIIKVLKLSFPTLNKAINELVDKKYITIEKRSREYIYIFLIKINSIQYKI